MSEEWVDEWRDGEWREGRRVDTWYISGEMVDEGIDGI